jgi:hypothetical protein
MTDQELEEDYREILDWFLIQSKVFQKNAKILSAKEHGQNFMLHIDKNTPKVFLPQMPRSASWEEDNTVGRVTVAPTLAGCGYGYARVESDFMDGPNDGKDQWNVQLGSKNEHYRGGYDICAIEFTHCISVNNALVFDAPRSGEKWLVTYNKKTMQYKPVKIGKLFFTSALLQAAKGSDKIQQPGFSMIGYLWHEKAEGIYLVEGKLLPPGYYRVNMHWDEPGENKKENPNNHTFTKISAGEYNQKKQLHASLLSESAPKFMGW